MATETWVRYETLVGGGSNSTKELVKDCLSLSHRFKGDTLRQFSTQILALKTNERNQFLAVTALPFNDLVSQASATFRKVDTSITAVKKFLNGVLGNLAHKDLRAATAKVISLKLKGLYQGSDRFAKHNFCFPITPTKMGELYRVDLNFSVFEPTTSNLKTACGKVSTLSGLLFTVHQDFSRDRAKVALAVRHTYGGTDDEVNKLVKIFCGDPPNAFNRVEAIADKFRQLSICSSSGFFGGINNITPTADTKQTYFLTLPKGTAPIVADSVRSWFTNAVLSAEPDTPFRMDIREVGDVGTRLELDVWGPPIRPVFWGTILSAGALLVKHVAAPLLVHHFGKAG